MGIGHIGYDPQNIVPVSGVEADGFFIGPCKHDFRPTSHSQGFSPIVQGFQDARSVLLDKAGIHQREIRGIETYGVFDKDDYLDICLLRVMLDIHAVFHQLYHCQKYGRVALPIEEIVNCRA